MTGTHRESLPGWAKEASLGDVSGRGTANGTPVHLWTCHGGGNQQWTLT
jgi:hypothetical protein